MPSVFCDVCHKEFSRQANVNKHKRSVHKIDLPINRNIKCLECNCKTFSSLKELRSHLKSFHQRLLTEEKKEFESISDFYLWKNKVEEEAASSYKNLRGNYENEKKERIYRYICHRSGDFKSESTGKRSLKSQKSSKIGFYCTSFITAVDTGERIIVTFGKEHYGHDMEIEHLRLSQEDRTWIAAKLKAGVTLQRVLDDIRDNFDGSNFKRLHMITRKDLNNIQRDFRLINTEATNVNEVDSVKMWVNSKKGLDHNPILYFKQQNEKDETNYFDDADFFVAIMTKAQKELFCRFGNDVICVDSTHGTNSADFYLITVLAIDEFRCGFPVAFCLTNKQDEHTLKKFFSTLKEQVGAIKCNSIMTDDAPAFHSAWNAVMHPPENVLLCSWHIDRAWRNQLKKVKGDDAKKALVYKSLRALMEYGDQSTFEVTQNNVLSAMFLDEQTKDFAQYFKSNYASRPQKWAFCFRTGCGINTNNHIESLHRVIKYVYFEGKKNKRIDRLLDILLKIVRDKMFERLIKLKKGRTCDKIKNIHERHDSSQKIPKERIIKVGQEIWKIKNKNDDDEYYIITQNAFSCAVNCKMICLKCHICVHMFTCNCSDNLMYGNICKHIHAIAYDKYLTNVPSYSHDNHEDELNIFHDIHEVRKTNTQKNATGYVKLALVKAENVIRLLQKDEKNIDEESAFKIVKSLEKIEKTLTSTPANKKREPANKAVQRQQTYKSTIKRKPLVKSIKKPTDNEKRYLIKSVNDNENVAFVHTGFDHDYL